MKPELKAKLMLYLNRKKQDEGFTLIELLMVMLLIGILSALAWPSFLSQAAKAQQSEAKTFVGAINRAQQAYRMENPIFASNTIMLQIGLHSETESYKYAVTSDASTAVVNANSKDAETLRSYAGGVVIITSAGLTVAVACQTSGVTNVAPTVFLSTTAGASCPTPGQLMQ